MGHGELRGTHFSSVVIENAVTLFIILHELTQLYSCSRLEYSAEQAEPAVPQ